MAYHIPTHPPTTTWTRDFCFKLSPFQQWTIGQSWSDQRIMIYRLFDSTSGRSRNSESSSFFNCCNSLFVSLSREEASTLTASIGYGWTFLNSPESVTIHS